MGTLIPPARGRGQGQLLMPRRAVWAATPASDALYLNTEGASAAHTLYERLGWQTINTGHHEDIDVSMMRTSLRRSA
jgi:GNAT superfamily N-acetyltransferase